ncbi:Rab8 family GTPase [Pelomyxa schiedti]|nr:Rab8 family GTPase [Pelomyxa schiedti]
MADPVELMVVGESGAGKTAIVTCYIAGKPSSTVTLTPDGEGFHAKTVKIGKSNVVVKTWDSAGEEKFALVTLSIFKKCKGFFIVFDLSDHYSFECVTQWQKQIERFNLDPSSQVFIVGNKKDLKPAVTRQQAEDYAASINATYWETSAVSGENIDTMFETMVENVLKATGEKKAKEDADKAKADAAKKPRKQTPHKAKGSGKSGGGGGCLLL